MLSDELIEAWKEQYDTDKECLLKVCDSYKDKDARSILVKAVAMQQQALEDAFRELAVIRKDDGNLVPVIMANITATNVAEMVVHKILQAAMTDAPPQKMILAIQNLLYFEVFAPFIMSYWDNLQKTLIEEELASGENST